MKGKSIFFKITVGFLTVFATLGITSCKGNLETNTHEVQSSFSNISIVTNTAEVVFQSTAEHCRVVCQEKRKVKHTVEVLDGVLTIKEVDTRAFFEKIFDTGKDKITVYLPDLEYGAISVTTDTGDVSLKDIISIGDIKIEADTGDVEVENCNAENVCVEMDTGKVELREISCQNLNVEVDTGNISMIDVVAIGKFEIESDTGDVRFDRCDANEVFITTDTGDVNGSFLSDKIIFAQTDTGKVDIPKLTSGGRCEIITDTGDIKITVD